MLSILGFLVILGPLVIVHELGHFTFAKIFGVKAEVFSVGFGPKLWSKVIGETEWRVSAIPMGGYVKLMGEDQTAEIAPAELKRALHKQAVWKRFFIFFGGPFFNFIFAALIFMTILAIGEPQPASVIGRVVEGSAAQKAGFVSGDRILAIDGKPVKLFEDVINAISDHPQQKMDFEVVHPQTQAAVHVSVIPVTQEGYSVYGETAHVGEIDGLLLAARSGMVGISDPNSPAGKVGIHTGDEVTQMNSVPIVNWEDAEHVFSAAPVGSSIFLKLKKANKAELSEYQVALKKPKTTAGLGDALGLRSSELFVDKAVPASPAEAAGIHSGDRLISVGSQSVQSFFELRNAVQRAGENEGHVDLKWERDGKIINAKITPTATSGRDPLLKKTTQYTVGVLPLLSLVEPPQVLDRILNPFMLVYKGTEKMITLSWRNLISIQKMFVGDVSVKSLGGPIMIGKIAGESLSHGLITFLTTMGILSIGLGVLNVLPIPVLDGGHLLLLLIEGVRKRPLSMKQMEIIQGVGLSLILLLMAVVMRNDIMRLPFFY